jgi:hypothetical protein
MRPNFRLRQKPDREGGPPAPRVPSLTVGLLTHHHAAEDHEVYSASLEFRLLPLCTLLLSLTALLIH